MQRLNAIVGVACSFATVNAPLVAGLMILPFVGISKTQQIGPVPRGGLFTLMILGLFAICAIFALLMAEARNEARQRTEASSANLATALAQDLDRNIELLDLSIQAARDGWLNPQIRTLSSDLRQLVMFDESAKAHYIDAILVLDREGDVVADSRSVTFRPRNFRSLDFFQAQQDHDDKLFVSRPFVMTESLGWCLAFSRRITGRDGRFAGVAVGILHLNYLSEVYRRLPIGQDGAMTLFNTDGTLLVREPADEEAVGRSFARQKSFRSLEADISGSLEGISAIDGKSRLYSFHRVGPLPLLQVVAVSMRTVYAEWRFRAVVIGGVLLALCSGILALLFVLRQELAQRIRVEKELSTLATQDSLTGLLNRRGFFDLAETALVEARLRNESVAMLMIDADHFKRYNDHYGHAAGDIVLSAIGQCILGELRPTDDLAARFGGEEFIVFLPGSDQGQAGRVAEAIRAAVAGLETPHERASAGLVTVSIGVASSRATTVAKLGSLVEAADGALYRAKRGGRNRSSGGEAMDSAPQVVEPRQA